MTENKCKGCECDENRILCKKLIENYSGFNNPKIRPDMFRKTKLYLALKHGFYTCKLTNVNVDQEYLKGRLRDHDIPINENCQYISCNYDGREYLLDHMRMGWCIVHTTDGIVEDVVELVS